MLPFTAATFNLPQIPFTNEKREVKRENMLEQMYKENLYIKEDLNLDLKNFFDTSKTITKKNKEMKIK